MGQETNTEKEHNSKESKPGIDTPQAILKVSKVIIDETTGTITLKIASEEEIAEAEKMKKEN